MTPSELTSTNYMGGDWAGVTQKINDGYFTTLGVNVLWITSPPLPRTPTRSWARARATSTTPATSPTTTSTPPTTATGPSTRRRPRTASAPPPTCRLSSPRRTRTSSRSSSTTRWCTSTRRARSTRKTRTTGGSPRSASAARARAATTTTSRAGSPRTWRNLDYSNAAALSYSINATISLIQANGNEPFRLDAVKQSRPCLALDAPARDHEQDHRQPDAAAALLHGR